MKSNKGQKVITIFGVILMAISGGIFVWYEWGGGRELVNYTQVVVLAEDAKKGDVITEDKLRYKELDKTSLIDGVITDPSKIKGKVAKHFIPANTQLHIIYFDKNGLVLKGNQVIAKIPVEWTLAVPDSLRRGDNIVIYAAMYSKEILNNLMPTITAKSTKSTSQTQSSNDDTQTEKKTTEEQTFEVTAGLSGNEKQKLTELLTTKVAYVKDSANREVVTVSANDRFDGSSTINGVEIVTTVEDFKKIEDKINQGGKLIIMYSDNKLKSK